ncbi:MAG: hypothetical protein WCP86_02595, partial [bacterium]
ILLRWNSKSGGYLCYNLLNVNHKCRRKKAALAVLQQTVVWQDHRAYTASQTHAATSMFSVMEHYAI